MRQTTGWRRYQMLLAIFCVSSVSIATQAQEAKTVVGPVNPELHDGAEALLAGDAEAGVRLTLIGLQQANTARERYTAWSNLCAGYVMLEQLDTALDYCNRVIEATDGHWRAYSNRALVYVKLKRYDEAEQDLQKGEALSPGARTLKAVRAMLRDAVEPVAPSIVIDDRRQPPEPGDDD